MDWKTGGYDVIGDVHGHAEKLLALLRKLGYREHAGSWGHPGRTAIFVGDFIDRGPEQLKSVETARSMVRDGKALAVMGNHEFNAIAWHTPDPGQEGEFLRRHDSPKYGKKNREQHAAFLREVEHTPEVHAGVIEWFMELPLWLDLPGIRVVHACWHSRFMEWLGPRLNESRRLRWDSLPEAAREPGDPLEKDTPEPTLFKAVEALTKGLEISLPEGFSFTDKDGITRRRVRVRWWDSDAATYRRAAIWEEESRNLLPEADIPGHARICAPADKPLFFGHYWLTGTPAVLSETAACVDYSAGRGGPLAAYRWDGESRLTSSNLVTAG